MLDYKNIIIKRYALNLSFRELAEEFGASRSGVNDFIRAFESVISFRILSRKELRIMPLQSLCMGMLREVMADLLSTNSRIMNGYSGR